MDEQDSFTEGRKFTSHIKFFFIMQGCGNTMPTCPTRSYFIQDKSKFLFTCPWTSTMYKVNTILYFIF